jgi:hypothetical protein
MAERFRTTKLLVACVVLLASLLVGVGTGAAAEGVFEGPVPRADCGPGSRPETALQGEVTIADRESGRSSEGYTCNLEQVGNYPGEGAGLPLAWYGGCAYYGTHLSAPPSPEAGFPGTPEKRGTIVLDVSDPASPRFSTNLTTPAMLDPGESLRAHEGRGLLAAVNGLFGHGPAFFDVYNMASDCAHPRLLASVPVNVLGHEGNWSPDGRTYYATGWWWTPPGILMAIDVSDPAAPEPIGLFFAATTIHGLGVSQDGKRLYLAHENDDHAVTWWAQRPSVTTSNGLGIYDVSEIAERKPNPQMRLVGEVNWTDGSQGMYAIPITSRGKPYVVFVDEGNYGGPRIIDISDETQPRIVSKLKLEIQMAENRELAHREAFTYDNENGGLIPFGYNSHYCNADRLEDPTILACSNWESGVRVFDIRDVHRPREIAYFNPGGDGKRRPASFGGTTSGFTSAQPRIIPERGEIWFTDMDRGFYVVRFTNAAWPFSAG